MRRLQGIGVIDPTPDLRAMLLRLRTNPSLTLTIVPSMLYWFIDESTGGARPVT